MIFCGWDPWRVYSWSQEGEDRILARIFEGKETGFYVDVGAHHPKRFSNTYLFYRKGWRGINIDAMPGSMRLFNKMRPRDINLELGVGIVPEIRKYYVFDEPALNGFSEDLSVTRNTKGKYHLLNEIDIKTNTLSNILNKHLPTETTIDFMSIDVEGLDFEVIKSNNWNKYRPNVLIVEALGNSIGSIVESKIHEYLSNKSYLLYAKCMNSIIYMDKVYYNEN